MFTFQDFAGKQGFSVIFSEYPVRPGGTLLHTHMFQQQSICTVAEISRFSSCWFLLSDDRMLIENRLPDATALRNEARAVTRSVLSLFSAFGESEMLYTPQRCHRSSRKRSNDCQGASDKTAQDT